MRWVNPLTFYWQLDICSFTLVNIEYKIYQMSNNPQMTEAEKHMQQLDFLLFIFYIQDREKKRCQMLQYSILLQRAYTPLH